MRYQKPFFMGALLALLGLITTQASAERLFATTLPITDSVSELVQLDPATGELVNTIGSVGYNVTGLTYDDTTGILYATTWKRDPLFPNGLITINQTTGVGSPVGTGVGLGGIPVLLATNSNGELYGWLQAGTDRLIRWDKATGSAIQVGNPNLTTKQHGIAFDNTNALLLFNNDDNVYQIDTTTGTSALLGAISDETPNNMAHHGDISAENNKYYGLDSVKAGSKSLLVIDPVTLTLDSSIPTINDLHALTFAADLPPLGECDSTPGINIQDVICTINKVLTPDSSPFGECDGEASINIQDVICVINKVLEN